MRRFIALMAVTTLIIAVAAVPAGAHKGEQESDIYLFSDETVDIGDTVLVRSPKRLSVKIEATGLTPRHAITVWWVIFNEPENCLTPYQCGLFDTFGEAFGGNAENVKVSVPYTTGGIVNSKGEFTKVASQQVGPADESANTFLGDVDFGLTNPMGAEVHLVVRDHGPLIPGLVHEQIGTFGGGCDPALNQADPAMPFWIDFDGTFPVLPGECNDIAFAVNPSPNAP
jgi:hypothetical protein